MATPNPAAPGEDRSRRILITQCLQNDLFLNPDCRLYLSDSAVKQLLVAKSSHDQEVFETKNGHRGVKPRLLREGPLGLFLDATIGERLDGAERGLLHVINIRDWHEHNESYDEERRMHGRHCEARTWGRSTSTASTSTSLRRGICRTGARRSATEAPSASTTCTPTRSSTSGPAGSRIATAPN